jgi:hypothetical protein
MDNIQNCDSNIMLRNTIFRKRGLFPSSGEREGDISPLGPPEGANVLKWQMFYWAVTIFSFDHKIWRCHSHERYSNWLLLCARSDSSYFSVPANYHYELHTEEPQIHWNPRWGNRAQTFDILWVAMLGPRAHKAIYLGYYQCWMGHN